MLPRYKIRFFQPRNNRNYLAALPFSQPSKQCPDTNTRFSENALQYQDLNPGPFSHKLTELPPWPRTDQDCITFTYIALNYFSPYKVQGLDQILILIFNWEMLRNEIFIMTGSISILPTCVQEEKNNWMLWESNHSALAPQTNSGLIKSS